MTRILAIDPGSAQSAWLRWADGQIRDFGLQPNDELLAGLRRRFLTDLGADVVIIEWTAPRGMPASAELFETLWWAGRFAEAVHPTAVERLQRSAIKRHLCGTTAANDSNVRAALIDRFGGVGGKDVAIGRKATPGPLYGISRDAWSALAIAVTWADTRAAG